MKDKLTIAQRRQKEQEAEEAQQKMLQNEQTRNFQKLAQDQTRRETGKTKFCRNKWLQFLCFLLEEAERKKKEEAKRKKQEEERKKKEIADKERQEKEKIEQEEEEKLMKNASK